MAKAPALSPTGLARSAAQAAEQARIDERLRAQAILNSPEGKAHPQLAQECIVQGMSLAAATGIMRAAGRPASSVYLDAMAVHGPIGITSVPPLNAREARIAEIKANAEAYNRSKGYV